MRYHHRVERVLILAIASLGLLLTACGGDQSAGSGTPGSPSASSAGGRAPSSAPASSLAVDPALPTGLSEVVGGNGSLAEGAAPPSSNVDPNGYTYTVQQYLDWVIKDLDTKWSPWFTSRGYTEPNVQYEVILPGSTRTSRCANMPVLTDTTPNAYYCSADGGGGGMIWLPGTTLQKMWSGDIFTRRSQRVGDFAAAILTAHEFGHHVADELRGQSTQAGRTIAPFTGPNSELVADCFAGVWAATAYRDGLLEPGDFEEAAAALAAIGDPPTVVTDRHGTPAERVAALQLGYNEQADPTPCVQTYWR